MVSSLTTILFMAFLFVAVGFIAGVMIVLARIEHEKNSSASSNREAKPAKPAHVPLRNETLYIWRDAKSGRVLGEWNGSPITDPRTLLSEQQTAIAALLSDWTAALGGDITPQAPVSQTSTRSLEEMAPSAQAPRAPTPAVAAPSSAPGVSPTPVVTTVETTAAVTSDPQMDGPISASVEARPQRDPAPAPIAPVARPTLNPVETKKEAVAAAPVSIVGQIDSILQEQLEGTPLQARGIRLVEDFKNGVIVQVGMERYPGIDTVQDPEVRAAIRAAAAEWERRSETRSRR